MKAPGTKTTGSQAPGEKPDPNRNLVTLEELKAVIETLQKAGVNHLHELHITDRGPGNYTFILETPRTEKSTGRPSICTGASIKDLHQSERTTNLRDMAERCGHAIQMMNDGAW